MDYLTYLKMKELETYIEACVGEINKIKDHLGLKDDKPEVKGDGEGKQ